MTTFIWNGLLFVAILAAIGLGGYQLWKKGKFTRIGFLPKPPTTTETK